jgi:hypothetical protein
MTMTRKEKAILVVQAMSGTAFRCTLCGADGPIHFRVREGGVVRKKGIAWTMGAREGNAPDSHMFCSRCVYRVKAAYHLTHTDDAVDMLKTCMMIRDFSEVMKKI